MDKRPDVSDVRDVKKGGNPMNVYGIEVNIKNIPKLDPGFIPMSAFTRAFEKSAAGGKEIVIAVERNQGQVAVRRCRIHGTPDKADADRVYVDRTVKMLLWAYGGWKVMICGDERWVRRSLTLTSPADPGSLTPSLWAVCMSATSW